MSVTIKFLALWVTIFFSITSLAAGKVALTEKNTPVSKETAHQTGLAKVAKSKPLQQQEVHTDDMSDLLVEEPSDKTETMEFYSQIPSEQETEKK